MEKEHSKNDTANLPREKNTGVFTDRVINYGISPRNYGKLEKPDGYAKITGPCGDTMEIFLRVKNQIIEHITYTTDGCTTSHAAGSAATVLAKGKTARECIIIDQHSILDHLGGLPEDSEHCALLAARTLNRALQNYATGKKR